MTTITRKGRPVTTATQKQMETLLVLIVELIVVAIVVGLSMK